MACFQWGCYQLCATGVLAQFFLGDQKQPGPYRCVSPVLSWRASPPKSAHSPGGISPAAGLCTSLYGASWGSSLLTSPVHPGPCEGLHNHLAHHTLLPVLYCLQTSEGMLCPTIHHCSLGCTVLEIQPDPWVTLQVTGPQLGLMLLEPGSSSNFPSISLSTCPVCTSITWLMRMLQVALPLP